MKLLRKSLVITLSFLCTLSTFVDVNVSASKAQEKLDRKLGDQIIDYDEKKDAYINKNSTWMIGNIKDYIVDVLIGVGGTLVGGVLGTELFRHNESNKGVGLILGATTGATILVPYVYRNLLRRWREKDNLGAQFILKSLERGAQKAKHAKVKEMAKSSGTGSYSIL